MLTPRQQLAKKLSPLHHYLTTLSNTVLLTQEEQELVAQIRKDIFQIVLRLEK